jgi:hypothetical protein
MEVWINGAPLSDLVGAYADVSYSETRQGGCDTAGWVMNRSARRHTAMRPGARVQIKDGPTPCFTGVLSQPDNSGAFTAFGYAQLGTGVLALDGVGAPTNVTDVAIFHAVNTRGDVPWVQGVSLTGAVGDATVDLTLNGLYDRYSSSTGIPWRVDHRGYLMTSPTPSTPTWAVQFGDEIWSLADTNYVTHVNVLYFTAGLTDATVLVSAADSVLAAGYWQKIVKTVDIRGQGIQSLAQAQAWGAAILARTGPKLQMTETITLQPGQLRNLGDVPAGWADVHAGQMIRLWGVRDRTKVLPTLHTDVVIGRVQRTRSTLTLTPDGAKAERFEDVMAELFERTS